MNNPNHHHYLFLSALVLSLVPLCPIIKDLVLHQIPSFLREFSSNFLVPSANTTLSRVKSVTTQILVLLSLDEITLNLFGFIRNCLLSFVVTFLIQMIPLTLFCFGTQSIQRSTTTQTAKIFLLWHLQEQILPMPITQLPVPENPLPQEREVYLLAGIYSKMNFEHKELEGVDPSLPRAPHNFHLMFATFSERLCHVPHPLHSTWETHVLQQEGHFQAECLLKLETDEINKSWRVAQSFQIPPCETGFYNRMVNGLSYPRKILSESYKGAR